MSETQDKMSYPELVLVVKAGYEIIFHVAFCDLAVPVNTCEMQTKTQI